MPGKIMLVGGHEDKQGSKEILNVFAEMCHFRNIGILTTASSVPKDVFKDYKKAFHDIKVNDVIHFDIQKNTDEKKFIEKLNDLDGLFFSGGDQQKLCDVLCDSSFITALKEKWHQGLVLGGTSAGASIWGSKMIVDAEEENHEIKDIKMMNGFGFIPNLIIDQHFSQRERFRRLIYEVGSTKGLGIGIDENTAAVYEKNQLKAVGENMVTIMEGRNITYFAEDKTNEGSVSGIVLHLITAKNVFCLETGKLQVVKEED
ncbi:cyanophycinase [Pseudalkalibacillus sp. R45]|uniref:cyanophycinase n=1 Tax=Pseudalkalibacillus sp. R45 TaxID=3457433 RepID=UPI003FCC2807